MNKPTLGRIVIFKDTNGHEWPAIVTKVHNDTCINLNYFTDSGCCVYTSCVLGTENFQWGWPKREE